jgi:galactokinase
VVEEWFKSWEARLGEAFGARAGRPPDGMWVAPGRVNLIGEHTDYNDGFALPLAVDRHVAVAAARRQDGRLRCWSLQADASADRPLAGLGPGRSRGWAAYPEGVAWALGQAGVEMTGADLVVDSDLPAGAGLSSSAALEIAVALALVDLAGAGLDPVTLAQLAQRAEGEVVGMPCGIMDQLASVAGRAGCAVLLDTRSLEVEPVPLGLEAAGLRLAVIDTAVPRRLVDAPYAERREACRVAADVLGVPALRDATLADVEAAADRLGDPGYRRARHVVTENARVLETADRLRAGRVASIGPLLAASHDSLRHDFEVSCPELDLAVATATAAGAAGARLTGAGFGGCAVALLPGEALGELAGALGRAFAERGYAPPAVLDIEPAGGARRMA